MKRTYATGRTHNVASHARMVALIIEGRPRIVNGYVRIYCPFHPAAMRDGTVYEHRLVAERAIGRFLEAGEFARRRNRDRADNRPENIYVARPKPPGPYAGRGKGWIRGLRMEENHSGWKGDEAGTDAKHTRAIRWYPIDRPCERCGTEEKLERHHIDADPGNNARSNIMIVCRRCHMEIDGRISGKGTINAR